MHIVYYPFEKQLAVALIITQRPSHIKTPVTDELNFIQNMNE